MVFDTQAAETPVGKSVAVPIPDAPVVAIVTAGESAALIHKEGEEDAAAAVLVGVTVTTQLPVDCV
jgi:hypothetical protein